MLPRGPALANAASHGSGSGVRARVSLRCIAIRPHCLRCSRRHRRGRAKRKKVAAPPGAHPGLRPPQNTAPPAITIKTRAISAYPISAGALFDPKPRHTRSMRTDRPWRTTAPELQAALAEGAFVGGLRFVVDGMQNLHQRPCRPAPPKKPAKTP